MTHLLIFEENTKPDKPINPIDALKIAAMTDIEDKPFEAIRIVDENGNVMPVTKGYPKKLNKYVLTNAEVYFAEGPAGIFLFQQICKGVFSFWISYYFSNGVGRIKAEIHRPTLELHFMLENAPYYKLKDLSMQVIRELQYNLLYAPSIHNEVILEEKIYFTFDIHFPLDILEDMSHDHPHIQDFISKQRENKTVELFSSPVFATPRMLYLLRVIQEHLSPGKGRRHLLDFEDAIGELFELALIKKGASKRGWLKYYHAEQLFYAEIAIKEGIHHTKILSQVRAGTGFSENKFREGFLEIFNKTPSQFLRQTRMDISKKLLKENNMVKDVAYMVGYTNPNSFTTDYTHYFGSPPRRSK